MENISPLEKLNIDCLHYIFQFLDVEDICKLYFLSNRFHECIKRFLREQEINFRRLAYSFCYREERLRAFLAICGGIKHVTTSSTNEYHDLLLEYCSNIKYMRIDFSSKVKRSWWSFLGQMQSLRSLFIYCDQSKKCPEKQFTNAIDEVVKLHDLESLRIHNARITGSRLNELTNLKELDLWNCYAVTSDHFINVFRANQNLTKINIHGCRLDSRAYRCMVEDSRFIETLEFDADLLDREFIPGLNHLQHLTIHYVKPSSFGDLLLREYSQACGQTLTSLTCHYWREFTIPETVVFPNLIEFNVYLGCYMDVVLRGLCNNCPRLEKVTAVLSFNNASPGALLDFFRTSKNVVFAKLHIWNCFSVSLYKEIVEIRRAFANHRTLRLVVYGEWKNAKFNEIDLFMKGNDYATLRKYVEIQFENNTYIDDGFNV